MNRIARALTKSRDMPTSSPAAAAIVTLSPADTTAPSTGAITDTTGASVSPVASRSESFAARVARCVASPDGGQRRAIRHRRGHDDVELRGRGEAGPQPRNSYEARGLEPPSNGTRPYLMGLAREDPESRYPGKAITDLFQHTAPRFLFAPSEQRVLQHAVMDESDEAIAAALDVSLDAVKKAWRRIFERVAAVDPELLGPGRDIDRRGKEKRRPLIQYVRYHLEELRPFRAEGSRSS